MRTRLFAGLAVLVLLAAGCGSNKKGSGSSGPQKYTVDVDLQSEPAVNIGSTAYFPEQLTVHAGDTVEFENYFTGEPHTVTMGTLADAGIADAKAQPPSTTGPPPEPASLKKLPDLLPAGPGDAPQVSASPCFISTGELPVDTSKPCPVQKQPEFSGTQAFYNSGYLESGKNFTVKLSKTVAPGKYAYFCLLHRAGMSGAITVVASNAKADVPATVAKNAKTAESQLTQQLQGAVTQAAAAAAPQKAVAGVGVPSVQNAGADVFLPTTISVAPGGTVTWAVSGPHTIAFNPSDTSRGGLKKAPDGSYHVNAEAFTPVPPGPPPLTGPGKPPVVIDGGKWDGSGAHSSGLMLAFGPPGSYSYKLTFTKAGTYAYECQLHPRMAGTVKVA